jgi:hypothetical protein
MTNFKPFDLEAFKAGKRAITRDVREATFVTYVEDAIPSHHLLVKVGVWATAYRLVF